jgi:Ion channel
MIELRPRSRRIGPPHGEGARMRARAFDYGAVLLLVVASIAVQMATSGSDATRFATIALQAATLAVAVRRSGLERGGVRLAAATALAAVLAALVTWIANGDIPDAASAIVNGLLVGVAPVAIAAGLVRELRETGAVTAATLAGVLAIYLLAGMLFSFLYGVVSAFDPDALFAQVSDSTRADQLYFSFVTLCTVGYGDLTPAADLPRALSIAEMLIGQIYLVTVVAVIVGHLGRRRERTGRGGADA